MTNITKKMICCVLGGIVLGMVMTYCVLSSHSNDKKVDKPMSDSTGELVSSTEIQAVPKQSPSDPDLILDQQYVAVINKKKVSVPITDAKGTNNSSSQSGSGGGSVLLPQNKGVTATVTQTVDLTPIVNQLRPKWELGVGYAHVDKTNYIPLSIQRNYATNKAIECTVLVKPQDRSINGFMVEHKWLLK